MPQKRVLSYPEDAAANAAPKKKLRTVPGLSADSQTVPPHMVTRGRLVNGNDQLLFRSWMLGPKDARPQNKANKVLTDYEHPCAGKSKCCECGKQYAKGDTVTKSESKTFCPGEAGLQHCVAPYNKR